MKRHPVLPEPDLSPYQVVAEEKTNMLALFGKQYAAHHRVPAGGHGARLRRHRVRRREPGVLVPVRHPRLQRRLRLRPDRLGRRGRRRRLRAQRVRRRPGRAQMDSASSAPSCSPAAGGASTRCTTPRAWSSCTSLQGTGTVLWLWSMYVYVPANYPTRMRALGTGWTDGVGHLGRLGRRADRRAALHRRLTAGASSCSSRSRARSLPGVLIAIFGERQRRRALEELSR